jgi:hypothetical protein
MTLKDLEVNLELALVDIIQLRVERIYQMIWGIALDFLYLQMDLKV